MPISWDGTHSHYNPISYFSACKDNHQQAQKNSIKHQHSATHAHAVRNLIISRKEDNSLAARIAGITAAASLQPQHNNLAPNVPSSAAVDPYHYLKITYDSNDFCNDDDRIPKNNSESQFAPWVDAIFDSDMDFQPALQYRELDDNDELCGIFDDSSSNNKSVFEMDPSSSDSDKLRNTLEDDHITDNFAQAELHT